MNGALTVDERHLITKPQHWRGFARLNSREFPSMLGFKHLRAAATILSYRMNGGGKPSDTDMSLPDRKISVSFCVNKRITKINKSACDAFYEPTNEFHNAKASVAQSRSRSAKELGYRCFPPNTARNKNNASKIAHTKKKIFHPDFGDSPTTSPVCPFTRNR